MQSSRLLHAAFIMTAIVYLTLSGPRTLQAAEAPIWSDPSFVHFDVLTLADGLSDSTVYSVSQDSSGQLWFGLAAGGVNRFDGYQVDAFLHDPANPASISNSAVGEVLATRSGELLVGTWGGGLNRLLDSDGRFERINALEPPKRIQVLFEDRQARIWIGSADQGLFRMDSATSSQLVPITLPDGQSFSRIWSLAEDADGRLWVATETGLVHLDGKEIQPDGGWFGNPRALVHDGHSLWVGDTQAVYRLVNDQLNTVQTGLPMINTLAQSPAGNILVGTLAGVVALDGNGKRVAPFGRSALNVFQDRNIRRIFFDKTGIGWIATREAGIILAVPSVQGFDGFRLDSSLDTVDTLIELDSADVLLGSRRGLWRLSQRDGEASLRQIPGSEGLSINRFALGADGVLIGTHTGLLQFDPVSEQLRPAPGFSAVADNMVTAISVNEDEFVDVGTFSEGLFRFHNNGTIQRFVRGGTDAIPGVAVSDIETDEQGFTWVGLWDAGIARISPEGNVMAFERNVLALEGLIHDLVPLGDEMWIATSFGLSRFDPATAQVQKLEVIPEFPNTAVQRLAFGAGRLWAATTRGVVAIDPKLLSVTRFTMADGLSVHEFYARSGHVGQNDRIYFGGLGGFVSFLPEQVTLETQPPQLAITRAWIDEQPVPTNQPLVLAPGQSTVRFRYLASDFRNSSANRFRWRLEGADPQWSETRSEPETLLTALTPGEYRFEVQGANANGLWNENPISIALNVLPAWWQTLAGQAAAVGALLLAAFLLSFWNTQRIRGRNRFLTAEVERQTRALREANQSLEVAATTDHLTGLMNRRGFVERVISKVPDSQRFFALLDADNFKRINDRHGHEIGDRVLRHVAELLQRSAPGDALVARWGGEEFVIHFSAATMDDALAAMEKVRWAIQDQQPGDGLPESPITITIGLAQMRPDESLMQTINRADASLLEGKTNGKNQVLAAQGTLV